MLNNLSTRTSRFELDRKSVMYIVFLGAMTALCNLSIDMSLPALPNLQRFFHVGPSLAARTLGIFILGYASGPILFGPLSDRYGRKPIMICGLSLYTLAGLGCLFAPAIGILLSCRFMQGVAVGAAAVLPAAIVCDVFPGPEGRKNQSYVTLVNNVGPLIAPTLGVLVLMIWSEWRSIYVVLGTLGMVLLGCCLLGFRETLPPERRTGNAKALVAGYATVYRNKRFRFAVALQTVTFMGMFAYITASPLVFMNILGLSRAGFAALFATTAAGTIMGSLISGFLLNKNVSHMRLLGAGVSVSAVSGSVLLLLTHSAYARTIPMAALVVINNICAGIVLPNATQSALEGLANVVGTGAALLRTTQMLGGSISSMIVGYLIAARGASAMATVMAICSWVMAALFWFGYSSLKGSGADVPEPAPKLEPELVGAEVD